MDLHTPLDRGDSFATEGGASAPDEITRFLVLRDHSGWSLCRALTPSGASAEPMRPGMDCLGLGTCLQMAIEAPAAHRVTYYRVNNEPVRFVFESRQPYPDPQQPWPQTLPAGSKWPVTWYRCRILLDGIDLCVAGATFVFGTSRADYSWPELSLLMTALSGGADYTAVVDGDPADGRPVLRVSRRIG